MRKLVLTIMLVAAVPLGAQNLDLSSLEDLRARADNVVSINIGPELFAFANAFLSSDDDEEAAALQITEGLEGIQVRVFEFDGPGRYTPEDIAAVRRQLDAEGWTRIIEVNEDDEEVGIWIYMGTAGAMGGMFILSQEEDEVAIVNIAGSVELEDVAALASQFNLGDLSNLGNLGRFSNFADDFDFDFDFGGRGRR